MRVVVGRERFGGAMMTVPSGRGQARTRGRRGQSQLAKVTTQGTPAPNCYLLVMLTPRVDALFAERVAAPRDRQRLAHRTKADRAYGHVGRRGACDGGLRAVRLEPRAVPLPGRRHGQGQGPGTGGVGTVGFDLEAGGFDNGTGDHRSDAGGFGTGTLECGPDKPLVIVQRGWVRCGGAPARAACGRRNVDGQSGQGCRGGSARADFVAFINDQVGRGCRGAPSRGASVWGKVLVVCVVVFFSMPLPLSRLPLIMVGLALGRHGGFVGQGENPSWLNDYFGAREARLARVRGALA